MEDRCKITLAYCYPHDTEGLNFTAIVIDGVDVPIAPTEVTDLSGLLIELNALNIAIWHVSEINDCLYITGWFYATQDIPTSMRLEDGENVEYILFEGDCVDLEARIMFKGIGFDDEPFNDWFIVENTLFVRQDNPGYRMEFQNKAAWLAAYPTATIEWVGYTSPTALSDTDSEYFMANAFGDYRVQINIGADILSNIITVDTTTIPVGFLLLGDSILDDVVVTDLGGGSTKFETGGHGDLGNNYVTNRVWKKIFDGTAVVDVTIDTNVDEITVNTVGVYAYFADDIAGGYLMPFKK